MSEATCEPSRSPVVMAGFIPAIPIKDAVLT